MARRRAGWRPEMDERTSRASPGAWKLIGRRMEERPTTSAALCGKAAHDKRAFGPVPRPGRIDWPLSADRAERPGTHAAKKAPSVRAC